MRMIKTGDRHKQETKDEFIARMLSAAEFDPNLQRLLSMLIADHASLSQLRSNVDCAVKMAYNVGYSNGFEIASVDNVLLSHSAVSKILDMFLIIFRHRLERLHSNTTYDNGMSRSYEHIIDDIAETTFSEAVSAKHLLLNNAVQEMVITRATEMANKISEDICDDMISDASTEYAAQIASTDYYGEAFNYKVKEIIEKVDSEKPEAVSYDTVANGIKKLAATEHPVQYDTYEANSILDTIESWQDVDNL